MKLSKKVTFVVGFLSAVPLLYAVLFILYVLGVVLVSTSHHEVASGDMPFRFQLFMLIHLSVMVLIAALLAFYVAHLFRTTAVPADKKALWAVVLFLGHFVAMPVYWYFYLWRPVVTSSASSPPPSATAV